METFETFSAYYRRENPSVREQDIPKAYKNYLQLTNCYLMRSTPRDMLVDILTFLPLEKIILLLKLALQKQRVFVSPLRKAAFERTRLLLDNPLPLLTPDGAFYKHDNSPVPILNMEAFNRDIGSPQYLIPGLRRYLNEGLLVNLEILGVSYYYQLERYYPGLLGIWYKKIAWRLADPGQEMSTALKLRCGDHIFYVRGSAIPSGEGSVWHTCPFLSVIEGNNPTLGFHDMESEKWYVPPHSWS